MRYVFQFFFSFGKDTLNVAKNEDEEPCAVFAFTLDGPAQYATGLREGGWSEEMGDWWYNTCVALEAKFHAVHDFSGTTADNDAHLEGFSTYEVESIETAAELAEAWRQAFVKRCGRSAGGISSTVMLQGEEAEAFCRLGASEIADRVDELLSEVNAAPTKSAPRP